MAGANPTVDRKTWLAILESASQRPGDEIDDQWRWLLQQLRMSADDYFALREALRQGRWRDAKNPRAYIKTVARREVHKEKAETSANDPLVLMPVTAEGDEFSVEQSLDHISHVRDTSDAIKGTDGIWRRGGGAERYYEEIYDEDENGNPVSLRGRLRAKLPGVLIKGSPKSDADWDEDWSAIPIKVDMKKWAKLAGFDEWEMKVLRYRSNEVSRDQALAEQPDEASRKAIQAAWRRYDRTGKQRLREVAEKNLQKDVPDGAVSHTS